MVGWFWGGQVPCLAVSTLENRLVTYRRSWWYKLKNLCITEGDRQVVTGTPMLRTALLLTVHLKSHRGKVLLLHNCKASEDRAGKTHGEKPSEIPPVYLFYLLET